MSENLSLFIAAERSRLLALHRRLEELERAHIDVSDAEYASCAVAEVMCLARLERATRLMEVLL
jgi:pentose-5-phosphate-3-epimerase